MRTRMFILVALFFCIDLVIAFGQTNTYSLKSALVDAADDSLKFSLLIDLHNAHFKTKPEESKYYAEKMIEMGEQTDNLFRKYKGHLALNRYETKYRNYDRIIPSSKMLLSLAKEIGDQNEVFERTLALAHNYIDGERNELVVPQLMQALSVAKANGQEQQVNKVNYALGFFFQQNGKNEKAIKYLGQTIAIFGKAGDTKSLANAIAFYAEAALTVNPDPKTLALLIQADKIHENNKSVYRQAGIRALIGKYFALTGDAKLALENYKFSQSMFKEHDNVVDMAGVNIEIAKELLIQKRNKEARLLILQAERIYESKAYALGKPELNIAWIQFYLSTGEISLAKKQLSALSTANKAKYGTAYLKHAALIYQAANDTVSSKEKYFQYLKALFESQQHLPIVNELRLLKRYYPQTKEILEPVASVLDSKQGFETIKRHFESASNQNSLLPETLLTSSHSDSLLTADSFGTHFLGSNYESALEAADAILNKKMLEKSIAMQNRLHSQNIKYGIIIGTLLIAIIGILFYYLRSGRQKNRRIEKDKATIETLRIQLNHLVVNNLRSIANFIDKPKFCSRNICVKTSDFIN